MLIVLSHLNLNHVAQSADVSELFSNKPEGIGRGSFRHKEAEELDFKATLLEVQKYGKSI